MRRFLQDFGITICGAATSFFVCYLLARLQVSTHFALYAVTFWFVIPAGAIFSGMVGASGYYAGAKLLQVPPSRLLLLNVLLVSIASYFLLQYTRYSLIPQAQAIPFSAFLDLVIRNTSLGVNLTPVTGGLGLFGYVLATLQVAGFALGGFGVFSMLSNNAYCDPCGCYMHPAVKAIRYGRDAQQMGKVAQVAADLLARGEVGAAGRIVTPLNEVSIGNFYRLGVQLWRCKSCRGLYFAISVDHRSGQAWNGVKGSARRGPVPTIESKNQAALEWELVLQPEDAKGGIVSVIPPGATQPVVIHLPAGVAAGATMRLKGLQPPAATGEPAGDLQVRIVFDAL